MTDDVKVFLKGAEIQGGRQGVSAAVTSAGWRDIGDLQLVGRSGLELQFKPGSGKNLFPADAEDVNVELAHRLLTSCAAKQDFPSAPTLIAIAGRMQQRISARRSTSQRTLRRRKKTLEAAAAFVCVSLAYIAAVGFANRLLEQQHVATVALDSMRISSPKTGEVMFILPPGPVQRGDAAAGIRTFSGSEFVIEAPCDCYLAKASVKNGDEVFKHKQFLQFWRNDTPEFISMRTTMDEALRLKSGASVSIRPISSGAVRSFSVKGDSVQILALPSASNEQPSGDVAVRIYPPVPMGLPVGEIVSARLRVTLPVSVLSTAFAKKVF
jgi:hypothetical protein